MLIVSIKNLGTHPCPSCRISKRDVPEVGTAEDDLRREDTRQDSEIRQKRVAEARRGIFERGWAVTSDNVVKKMGKNARSEVPVEVRVLFCAFARRALLHKPDDMSLQEHLLQETSETRCQRLRACPTGCSSCHRARYMESCSDPSHALG